MKANPSQHHSFCTLGIDLASSAEKTAFVHLKWTPLSSSNHWSKYQGEMVHLHLHATDQDILSYTARSSYLVGLDAPLGWPKCFIDYISTPLSLLSQPLSAPLAQALSPSLKAYQPWTADFRDQMRYRQTDLYTRSILGRWPLSVSTDYLSLVGLRARGLLRAWHIQEITGQDGVYEVYPAVALKRWNLKHRSYKGKEKSKLREEILAQLLDQPHPLSLTPSQKSQLIESDHGFDAFLCSLITFYAYLGYCDIPLTTQEKEASLQEGWIYIPFNFKRLNSNE